MLVPASVVLVSTNTESVNAISAGAGSISSSSLGREGRP